MEGIAAPDIETLRRIRSLSQFSDSQLGELAGKLTIERLSKKHHLIERGCTENFSLYLLQGNVTTIASDGIRKIIESSALGELTPIAQIRPSIYDVIANGAVQFLKIHADQLTEFAQRIDSSDGNMEVMTINQSQEENDLTIQLFQDMLGGKLSLPSLPDVAQRIQQAFSDDTLDAESVSAIVQSDPVITAKLIMVANSALYSGSDRIETLQKAVVRLGLKTTRIQVLTYAIKELFQARSAEMKMRMQSIWKHSQKVAIISRLLAIRLKCFDAEQAQLAGLIHDLGEVAILQYAQQHEDLREDPEKLLKAIKSLRSQITGMLLNQWNFGSDYVTVGEESEDWFRNPADQPDLCDLVLIAQYHSYIGTPMMSSVPPISKLPAFAKLGMSDLTHDEIVGFMKESKAEIDAIESNLGAL